MSTLTRRVVLLVIIALFTMTGATLAEGQQQPTAQGTQPAKSRIIYRKGCTRYFTWTEFRNYARRVHSTKGKIPTGRSHLVAVMIRCQFRTSRIAKAKKFRDRLWVIYVFNRARTGEITGGGTSWFSGEGTADGGDTSRPCIAMRDTSTLGDWFLVKISAGDRHRHWAVLLHCDSGPYVAGREIDITPMGLHALGFSTDYCNCYGTAERLRYRVRIP